MFSIVKTSHKIMLSHKVMLSWGTLRRSAQVLSLQISWVAAASRNLGTITRIIVKWEDLANLASW